MVTTPVAGVAGGYRHPAPSSRMVRDAVGGDGGGRVTLDASYALCRRLSAAHGRTYHLATRLLPRASRPHVHALYAFARYADDLVDHLELGWSPERRRAALESWSAAALEAIARGESDDPVLKAAGHTIGVLGISHDDVRSFLASMAMDLTVTRYATYADLAIYMHGSAAVIGTMMLPVLGAVDPRARAPAMDLGVAFQLTNFLRDVAEDWDRGRIYLPLEDLERFGVGEWEFRTRHVSPPFRRLLAFEAGRARSLYRRAEAGWALLPGSASACVRVAHRLYGGILDALERSDYQVFRERVAVRPARRAGVLARELVWPSRATACVT